jgi:hypothetical protein
MSWFTQSANETEAAKERYCMFLAVDFDFLSGHQRYWSGIGTLSLFGSDYLGTGELGKISTAPEHVRLIAETKTFQLSGVDIALVDESDLENCFGRSVTEYFGFINPDTGRLHELPETNWEGYMGRGRRVDGSLPIIEINAEHRLAELDKPDGWRYTHEHQQQFYPGDLGFREMPSVETTEVLWGGYRVYPGSGSVSGSGNGRGTTRRR